MTTGTEEETPLAGGRVTQGVVRVGDTVRRPATGNSSFVRGLLAHLAANDFTEAPGPLGTDEQGRDIFSFIDGEVPADLAFHDDATLRAAALLIRRYHDATTGLITGACARSADIVCHNDLSPCNFVFRDGRPAAIIDFDAAAPGYRVDDLAYAAWLWLDIGNEETSAAEQARRLRLFADAYGAVDEEPLLEAMLKRQAMAIRSAEQAGDAARAAWARTCLAWTVANFTALAAASAG
jgi:Ser/Thr protein kinase RdoA (MazF antagonist)